VHRGRHGLHGWNEVSHLRILEERLIVVGINEDLRMHGGSGIHRVELLARKWHRVPVEHGILLIGIESHFNFDNR